MLRTERDRHGEPRLEVPVEVVEVRRSFAGQVEVRVCPRGGRELVECWVAARRINRRFLPDGE